jgi:filamentous hemagglutinin
MGAGGGEPGYEVWRAQGKPKGFDGSIASGSNEFTPAKRSGLDFNESFIELLNGNKDIKITSDQQFNPMTGEVQTPSRRHPEGAYQVLRGYFNSEQGELFIEWYSVSAPSRNHGVGTEMISRAIEGVGPENVRSIRAEIAESNKARFLELREKGSSITEAAAGSWLGRSANNFGFSNVQIIDENKFLFRFVKE